MHAPIKSIYGCVLLLACKRYWSLNVDHCWRRALLCDVSLFDESENVF